MARSSPEELVVERGEVEVRQFRRRRKKSEIRAKTSENFGLLFFSAGRVSLRSQSSNDSLSLIRFCLFLDLLSSFLLLRTSDFVCWFAQVPRPGGFVRLVRPTSPPPPVSFVAAQDELPIFNYTGQGIALHWSIMAAPSFFSPSGASFLFS